jgi:hypothetical protein
LPSSRGDLVRELVAVGEGVVVVVEPAIAFVLGCQHLFASTREGFDAEAILSVDATGSTGSGVGLSLVERSIDPGEL